MTVRDMRRRTRSAIEEARRKQEEELARLRRHYAGLEEQLQRESRRQEEELKARLAEINARVDDAMKRNQRDVAERLRKQRQEQTEKLRALQEETRIRTEKLRREMEAEIDRRFREYEAQQRALAETIEEAERCASELAGACVRQAGDVIKAMQSLDAVRMYGQTLLNDLIDMYRRIGSTLDQKQWAAAAAQAFDVEIQAKRLRSECGERHENWLAARNRLEGDLDAFLRECGRAGEEEPFSFGWVDGYMTPVRSWAAEAFAGLEEAAAQYRERLMSTDSPCTRDEMDDIWRELLEMRRGFAQIRLLAERRVLLAMAVLTAVEVTASVLSLFNGGWSLTGELKEPEPGGRCEMTARFVPYEGEDESIALEANGSGDTLSVRLIYDGPAQGAVRRQTLADLYEKLAEALAKTENGAMSAGNRQPFTDGLLVGITFNLNLPASADPEARPRVYLWDAGEPSEAPAGAAESPRAGETNEQRSVGS